MSLNRKTARKILSVLLAAVLVIQPAVHHKSFAQTGSVNTDCLNVRSGPGTSYASIKQLSTNSKVTVLETLTGNDGMKWYKVSYSGGSGYIRSDFINLDVTYSADDTSFEEYLNSQGFPESYKNSLRGLHQKYPNWIFTAQHTGLDWNEVIAEETKIGRNLVESDSVSSWKSLEDGAFDWAGNYWPGFDGSTWVAASEGVIRHYMDPRNFLTDPYIFQFEVQKYDSSLQTREGLVRMVEGTFLSGYANGNTGSSSYGPGVGSVNKSGDSYGPGMSSNNSSSPGPSSSDNENSDSSGSGNVFPGNITLVSPDQSFFSFIGAINAYADWQLDQSRWIYRNNDGSLKTSGWFWLDGNNDGIAECYYFYDDGTMASNTTVDGYYVNSDGKWVENGIIKTKSSGSGPSSVSYGSSSGSRLYLDIIMDAAKQSGVSPYVLAAMIIQEQGKQGTSPLISGNYNGYNGYYNFYNIGAYEHDGMSAVEAGLKYASESGNGNRPWNTAEKGIIGGAIAYGANYTDSGQDTFYLKKYNVQGSNKYNHQYMTNVVAAAQEGAKISDAYSNEIKSGCLTFKIPVYNNMPDIPYELPTDTGNPNNKLSSLYIEEFTLTPTFNMNTYDYSLIVDSSVSNLNIIAQTIDNSARVNGSGILNIYEGLNEIKITVTAQNGDTREYRIQVNRRAGGAVGNGNTSLNNSGPGITINNQSSPNADAQTAHESTIIIGAPPM